ncbi:heterokaryon incompatibility protein-domain-containing protein [Leptodontidium sp. MPI-SDFR-AT-0119]|nr:heterokaryon incompatibility protein-domain-containing protein [Leptodontidium sp. MPI-SDFR-AT-0119]
MMAASQSSYAQLQTLTYLVDEGQVLVDLPRGDIRELLSEAAEEGLHASAVPATVILERMGELNATLKDSFQPKKSDISTLNLRVILPKSSMPNGASAPKITSFIAVSYCWHTDNSTPLEHQWLPADAANPIVPGWDISRPMMDVVMSHVRRVPDAQGGLEGVWLDKLCIQQTDQAEKVDLVGAMDTIYHSARRVVILLEDIKLSAREDAAGLAYAQFYHDLSRETNTRGLQGAAKGQFIQQYFPRREQELREEGKAHIIEDAKDFACKILSARWFSRAWCLHESRMARHLKVNNPLFLCFGHTKVLDFEFRCLYYIAMYLHSQGPCNIDNPFENLDKPNPTTLQQLWYRMVRLRAEVDPEVSAMEHFVNVLSSGCKYKQDLVSIALNTARLPIVFKLEGDNVGEADLLWIFSILVLATGDLTPLVMMGSKLEITNQGGRKMISWAVKPPRSVLGNREKLTMPESITAVTGEYIELDLLVFDTFPIPPSSFAMQAAETIINKHCLQEVAKDFMATDDFTASAIEKAVENLRLLDNIAVANRPGPGPFSDSLTAWLALALDCGLDWIKQFPDAMLADTRDRWTFGTLGEIANPILTDAARSVLAFFSADANDDQTLKAVIRCMTCLLDNRLIFFTMFPRRIEVGPQLGGSAITSFSGDKLRIAVPAAIAHLPGWHKRVWAIEPFTLSPSFSSSEPSLLPSEPKEHEPKNDAGREDGEGIWQVKMRHAIFGCPCWDLGNLPGGNSKGWVLRKGQKVYGGMVIDGET